MLGDTIYLPGASVLISDIGEQPADPNRADAGSTLVCVTTNVNTACCRGSENPNGGSLGNWYYPDGSVVPTPGAVTVTDTFLRIVFTEHVRLSSRGSTVTEPVGVYRCDVPNGTTGIIVSASINIVATLPGKRLIQLVDELLAIDLA